MNYKKGTQTRGCMKSVMRYVSQLGKTLWDGQQLVSGIGCQPETAFDEFLSTKLLHHKDGGVQFYHLSLIHISEPTRQAEISYAVFCLKKKKKKKDKKEN